MIKAVIITANKSDCKIAEDLGFKSISMTDICVSEGYIEKLQNEADVFYLLFYSNENQSTSEEMLNLAKFMFSNSIEAEIIIFKNSLKD